MTVPVSWPSLLQSVAEERVLSRVPNNRNTQLLQYKSVHYSGGDPVGVLTPEVLTPSFSGSVGVQVCTDPHFFSAVLLYHYYYYYYYYYYKRTD